MFLKGLITKTIYYKNNYEWMIYSQIKEGPQCSQSSTLDWWSVLSEIPLDGVAGRRQASCTVGVGVLHADCHVSVKWYSVKQSPFSPLTDIT